MTSLSMIEAATQPVRVAHDTQLSGVRAVGRSLALALWRFWDPDARVILSNQEWSALTPVLLAHGMGAFARRHTGHGIHGARARSDLQRLKHTLALLDKAEVRYLVSGGFSCAGLYPEPGLRPLDRLELLLDTVDLPRAEQALQRAELRIDYRPMSAAPFTTLVERSRCHELLAVRALGAEDELRLALLRLNAVDPLWLCDVAVLLERGPQTLDVERVLAGSPWNACAVQLARDVLGARVPSAMVDAVPAQRSAPWVERSLLTRWGRPATTLDKRAFSYVRQPKLWPTVLRDRLPDPVQVNASARVSPQCGPLRAGLGVAVVAARQLVKYALRIM
ncbi:MAG TPA: hypothetical protein VFX59_02480 [Polyangiales bacterium]|nr:hypothetical protein [Polyangiales bacterium]